MKILVISALYPPYHSGGYEIRIKNIMDELSCRGHEIWVLTNKPEGKKPSINEAGNVRVIRSLHDQQKAKFFPKEIVFDLLDTGSLENQLTKFKPDIIYLGHTYLLSKTLLPFLATRSIPILYDEGGIGLIEAWTEHGRWFRFTGDYRSRFAILNAIKPAVIEAVCRVSRGKLSREWAWPENLRVVFNSELNRQNALSKGVPFENSSVIHSGIDTKKFVFKRRASLSFPVKIIVPGRIERRKGQLDAVLLYKRLMDTGIDARLLLIGAKWTDGYFEDLIFEITRTNFQNNISILPMASQEELVQYYQEADICFFPSYQEIGFSRVPLEAMACGCILISYGNEGSDEVIRHGQNGYIVKPAGFSNIVELVMELSKYPDSVQQMAQNARRVIDDNFEIKTYIDQIEEQIRQMTQNV